MFIAKKSQKPNILRKKPLMVPPDRTMATTSDRIVTMKVPPPRKSIHRIVQHFGSVNDSTDEFNVVIDAKHNISLVPSKSQYNNNVCQAVKESSLNLNIINQEAVLDNGCDAQKKQINMPNVFNITESHESLQSSTGSRVENVNTKTVITEEDILGNSIKPLKYKCDPCNKRFISEKKYLKHLSSHNKDPAKITKPTLECPARKTVEEGVTESCGKTFLVREELLKHLNEDHTPEDARYKCGSCSRRFFWSLALTGHGRGGCGRGELRCGWAGCARSFLQPCRLREHMRVHTGEKPYRCHYPGCTGGFRSASKLRRHVVRHTGERRHACACGRAYLRADHLADHHLHCRAKLKSASPLAERDVDDPVTDSFASPDLLQSETQDSISSMTLECAGAGSVSEAGEMKFEARSAECPAGRASVGAAGAVGAVRSVGTAGAVGTVGAVQHEADTEWQSARTHCTWPLSRTQPETENVVATDQLYVLEEGVQVEMQEENSNNIYTIRSDLFLHGNVLNNEDNEMITSGPEVEISQPLDAELSLLDSHPTTDLLQEELMYTNVTIDDSLFRVFYLSEELAAPSPS